MLGWMVLGGLLEGVSLALLVPLFALLNQLKWLLLILPKPSLGPMAIQTKCRFCLRMKHS